MVAGEDALAAAPQLLPDAGELEVALPVAPGNLRERARAYRETLGLEAIVAAERTG